MQTKKSVARIKGLLKKVAHAKGDFNMAFARLRDSPMANSKMSPASLMFRRILRFPVLPLLSDNVDEVAAGEEKQARKVVDKEKRNKKVSKFGKEVVELEEVLHVLLQDNQTKLFDNKAQVIRVCEGGRSAYVQGLNRRGRVKTYLRNRRFMIVDPKFRAPDGEESMATGEAGDKDDRCLPLKQLARKAKSVFMRTQADDKDDSCLRLQQLSGKTRSAFMRTQTLMSSILKGSLTLLTRAQGPAAGKPRRRAVSWATTVSQ